jgi:hypothetical protein
MSEKAHGAAACLAVFAQLGAILAGVQPALVDAVRIGARVAEQADALFVFGARNCIVAKLTGVTAADGQVAAARTLWKTVSAAGLHAQYHSEESGKWTLKTAANAPASP